MTESMNLDSSDILEFDPLDTSLEEELAMYNRHEEQMAVNEIHMTSGDLMKEEEEVVKEEVVEGLEEEIITEGELMEETISYDDSAMHNSNIESVMDIVEDRHDFSQEAEAEDSQSNIQNDNEMFTGGVIDEEIVTESQVEIDSESRMFEDPEPTEKDFQDINDMMPDGLIGDESNTAIPEVKPVPMESEATTKKVPLESNQGSSPPPLVEKSEKTSSVFVVPSSVATQPTLQTATIATSSNETLQTGQKVTRLLVSSEQAITATQPPPLTSTTGQTFRIVASQGKVLSGSPKTITFAQAKQMGLLNFNQIIQPAGSKGGVSKVMIPRKTVTVMKSSPAKILPAPPGSSPARQKVVIRSPGGALKAGTLLTAGSSSTGVFRIPPSQATQLGLQSPNKQVQFVKLVGNSKGGATLVPVQAISTKTIPVALPNSLLGSQQTTFKVVPITSQGQASVHLTQASPGQRLIAPVLAPAASAAPQPQSAATPQRSTVKLTMIQPPPPPVPIKEELVEETVNTTTDADITVRGEEVVVKTTEIKAEPECDMIEANGIRPRKPCNCTKSMCLKLYCDCFANGEFCHQCNCTTCYNNLSHEEERQRAIKSCLERNPSAFRPKIGKTFTGSEERRHNKGCNCRRSGCLKNYCECYEAKIPCSKNCKCFGCKNTEAFLKRGLGMDDDKYLFREKSDLLPRSPYDAHAALAHRYVKQVLNYMSPSLIEASTQCLVAQVEEWSRAGSTDIDLAQTLVIEELGRCLSQLIDCINKSISQIPQSSVS